MGYAIIETGGKQYRVEQGDVIDVELSRKEDRPEVEFRRVLFINDNQEYHVGSPYVENGLVKGVVLGEVKGPKVISFKYKRRKGYRRKVGHRQGYRQVKILEIVK